MDLPNSSPFPSPFPFLDQGDQPRRAPILCVRRDAAARVGEPERDGDLALLASIVDSLVTRATDRSTCRGNSTGTKRLAA